MKSYLNAVDAATLQPGIGLNLRDTYNGAKPFPHILIDNFLPCEVLDRCLAEFPPESSPATTFNRSQERLKRCLSPDTLPPWSRHLFYSFNSTPFMQVLENITGINGLIILALCFCGFSVAALILMHL